MSLSKKIILAVALYLIFLVVYLPTKWLVSIAPLPANVSLSGVTGSVWNGQIDLVQIGPRQIEQLKWQLSPWALLLGQANVDINLGNRATAVSGKADVSWSLSGVKVQGLRFDAPNSFLIAGARLPFGTQIQGEVSLMVADFIQGKPWCEQLSGKLFLNHADMKNQFGEYPLGNMALALICQDGQVAVSMTEADNKLGISGLILLGADNSIKVTAKVKATDGQPQDMRNSLAYLGKPDSQGYYPVNYQGRLPGM
ncbi:type II secretion system protein N [Shewanella sp.]|uniref:type II secretion system protein N n=1 Tax=Shewanella sp. TaxID=50422 RepID=UPI004054146A